MIFKRPNIIPIIKPDVHAAKYNFKNASMSTWTALILSRSLRVNIGILHLPINFNVS